MPHALASRGRQGAGRRRLSRPWPGSSGTTHHASSGGLAPVPEPEPTEPMSALADTTAARTVLLSWSGHVPDEMELMQHLQLQLELVDSQCQNLYQQLDTVKQQQRAERHAAAVKLAAEQAHHAETMTELVTVSAELTAVQRQLQDAHRALAVVHPVQVTFVIGRSSSSICNTCLALSAAADSSCPPQSQKKSDEQAQLLSEEQAQEPTAEAEAKTPRQKRQSEPATARTAGAAVVVRELEGRHAAAVPVQSHKQQQIQQQTALQARASEGGSVLGAAATATAAAVSIKRSVSAPGSSSTFVPALCSQPGAPSNIELPAEDHSAAEHAVDSSSGGSGCSLQHTACDSSSTATTDGSKCSAGGAPEALAAADAPQQQPQQQQHQQERGKEDGPGKPADTTLSPAAASAVLKAPFNFCSSRVVPIPEPQPQPEPAARAVQPALDPAFSPSKYPTVGFSFTASPGSSPAPAKAKKSTFSFRNPLKQLKKPAAPPAMRHSASGNPRYSASGNPRNSSSGGCSVIPIGRYVATSPLNNKKGLIGGFFRRSNSCAAELIFIRKPAGAAATTVPARGCNLQAATGKREAGSSLGTMLMFGTKKVKKK